MNEIPEPGRATMLLRGCTRRCPRCGSGRLFHRWFVMVEECSGCGLHFEREPGYWVGAMAMNIIAVGGIFAVVFVTLLALTLPDIPVIPLLATLVPIAALGPIALYPFSKTLWSRGGPRLPARPGRPRARGRPISPSISGPGGTLT
ncbi:MAG: DUF983 domain-containing protein [Acidimicrobiia bacterium]|nr:DUF983 domain-containing protein [Acidimicrobiia bacterium]